MSAMYHPYHPLPAYQTFAGQFEARYNRQPGLGASHTYEAVLVLAEALKYTGGQAEGLPEALAQINNPGCKG